MFTYNKIYYFRYAPVGVGKLPVFDQFPLVLPLKIVGSTFIGINAHWIPGPLRYKFCLLIGNIYERTEPKERFHMVYLMLKQNPALAFCLMGLRKYYISRCMNIIEIPGEEWENLPIMSTSKFRARYMRQISTPGNV